MRPFFAGPAESDSIHFLFEALKRSRLGAALIRDGGGALIGSVAISGAVFGGEIIFGFGLRSLFAGSLIGVLV